ncbi:MAG TPA: crossover junction endodeoxyribonuclease RuvC [Candidatus Limnocylindria bacterium]|nr:crossover junction endodeoxyribonuclease RuvC [Candidatus Limnocylindria bacterium]
MSKTWTTFRRYTRTSTCPKRSSSTPSPDTVLGIDPGTTGMGYALLALDRDPPRLIAHGLVATPRLGSSAEKLLAIAEALDEMIATYAPGVLALERLYFNKNARTAMAVAEARGVALVCGARAGLAIAEYTPQEVKQSVTGNGGADKRAVQRMIVAILELAEPITQDNVADAIAIALTHAQRVKFTEAVASAE